MIGEKMFKNIPPEVLLAEALLKVEPEKIDTDGPMSGSSARRDWLKLVLDVEGFILRNKLNNELFKNCLNGPSCDGVD
jgi:hypothetical protein